MSRNRIEHLLCAIAVLAFGLLLLGDARSNPAARALDSGTVAQEGDAFDHLRAGEIGRRGILAVAAPSDAQAVELRFPFGLTLPMRFDPDHQHWHALADVPVEVPDGIYQVSIKTTLADGSPLWQYSDYQLGAVPSDFELSVDEVVVAGEALDLLVDPITPLTEVTVEFTGLNLPPAVLRSDAETGLYHLEVPVPRDFQGRDFEIRVIGTDATQRSYEHKRTIEVIPAIECCHEEPEEDC